MIIFILFFDPSHLWDTIWYIFSSWLLFRTLSSSRLGQFGDPAKVSQITDMSSITSSFCCRGTNKLRDNFPCCFTYAVIYIQSIWKVAYQFWQKYFATNLSFKLDEIVMVREVEHPSKKKRIFIYSVFSWFSLFTYIDKLIITQKTLTGCTLFRLLSNVMMRQNIKFLHTQRYD